MEAVASLRTCGSWDAGAAGLDGAPEAVPPTGADEAVDPGEPVVPDAAPAEEEAAGEPAAWAPAAGLLECEHELADHTTAAARAAQPAIARADERGDAEAP